MTAPPGMSGAYAPSGGSMAGGGTPNFDLIYKAVKDELTNVPVLHAVSQRISDYSNALNAADRDLTNAHNTLGGTGAGNAVEAALDRFRSNVQDLRAAQGTVGGFRPDGLTHLAEGLQSTGEYLDRLAAARDLLMNLQSDQREAAAAGTPPPGGVIMDPDALLVAAARSGGGINVPGMAFPVGPGDGSDALVAKYGPAMQSIQPLTEVAWRTKVGPNPPAPDAPAASAPAQNPAGRPGGGQNGGGGQIGGGQNGGGGAAGAGGGGAGGAGGGGMGGGGNDGQSGGGAAAQPTVGQALGDSGGGGGGGDGSTIGQDTGSNSPQLAGLGSGTLTAPGGTATQSPDMGTFGQSIAPGTANGSTANPTLNTNLAGLGLGNNPGGTTTSGLNTSGLSPSGLRTGLGAGSSLGNGTGLGSGTGTGLGSGTGSQSLPSLRTLGDPPPGSTTTPVAARPGMPGVGSMGKNGSPIQPGELNRNGVITPGAVNSNNAGAIGSEAAVANPTVRSAATTGTGTFANSATAGLAGEGTTASAAQTRPGMPPMYPPPMGGAGAGAGKGSGGGGIRPGNAEGPGGPEMTIGREPMRNPERVGVPDGLRGRSDGRKRDRVRDRRADPKPRPPADGHEEILDEALWHVDTPRP